MIIPSKIGQHATAKTARAWHFRLRRVLIVAHQAVERNSVHKMLQATVLPARVGFHRAGLGTGVSTVNPISMTF